MPAITVNRDQDTATEPAAATPDDDTPRSWIFTFGAGHRLYAHRTDGEQVGDGLALSHRYVRIKGTYHSARAEMVRQFGTAWSHQYATEAEAGVARFNLRELTL